VDDNNRRFTAFTKGDCRELQVLQNQTQGINEITNEINEINLSTDTLLSKTNQLSVNQLGAFHTAMPAFKAIRSSKAAYLSSKLKLCTPEQEQIFPH
jgi:hypothetical protein